MKKLAHIAYNQISGKNNILGPTVVFMGGFRSDMTGSKATFLQGVCAELGLGFVRFDYSGHGASEGIFEDCTIGTWKADALKVIDELTSGELILIGSSMGAWLMLLTALERQSRIKALIGIASAPDFTERLIWAKLTPRQQQEMQTKGKILIPNCYDNQEPYPITKQLIEEARKHLLLKAPIPLTAPVRLLHGMMDEDVPFGTSYNLAQTLASTDIELHMIQNGDHRLSNPSDLELLKKTLIAII
jgi:pimeloyl-ACP methyl ester carboxylesterase